MPATQRYELLRRQTQAEFPRFNIKLRSSSWLRPIFWIFEKISGRSFANFATTIGSTIYVGDAWGVMSDDNRYGLLRHEKKHIEQFHRWPLGRWAWPINHAVMAFCYLLLLPILLTFRAHFEREGYTQTLLVQYELYGRISDEKMEKNALWLAEIFGGPSYFFMWRRRRAYEWAMETQRKINAGELTNPQDRVDEPNVA